MKVFTGTLIQSRSLSELEVLNYVVVGVSDEGRVVFVEDDHTEELLPNGTLHLKHAEYNGSKAVNLNGVELVQMSKTSFLVPGLIDTHTHAPQFTFAGTGYDLQLLQWLETYTFPFESKFSDLEHARRVYSNVVHRTLSFGSTTCVYFATIHTDASIVLASAAARAGQRAFVGKVNMDRNSPDFYVEETKRSLAETDRFLTLMRDMEGLDADAKEKVGEGAPMPLPILTPRFVPTCSSELMFGLGTLAEKYNLPVQSHVSENLDEIAWVHRLHPDCDSYAGTYDKHGLLRKGTLLAHGVYLTVPELVLMKERGSTVSHCPMSNSMLRSGATPVRTLLDQGVNVALGTDVSGGASPSMLCSVREALKVSNLVSVQAPRMKSDAAHSIASSDTFLAPLNSAEAFYLATVGGAKALDVDGLTGTLAVGSIFDALVIDAGVEGSAFDLYGHEVAIDMFQKWLQLGDDRNVSAVYVAGRKVV